MSNKLRGKGLLLVGFTLFSMFFGAGNLIFPPDLGAKAGTHFWPAFLGLAISAVGLPVAGVVAVARAQGLEKLAGRVHPVFAQVFMILIYLSIGPCLAIPRTASTSFAMLAPLVGTGAGLQLGYSAVFFAAAFLVALRPERLTRWLGRLLCPCLLVLILVLFGGCLLHPLAGQYGTPTPEYTSGAVLQGVLYGYQTMDTLAALNFGAIIALNIQAQGITRQEEVQHAQEEQIRFQTLTNPVEILGYNNPDNPRDERNGFVTGMRCIRMRLGEPDERGRCRPEPIPDSEFTLEVDTVVMSIGTTPNPLIKSTTDGLDVNSRGGIITDEHGATSRKGVFAGGDAVTGAATVISAMGAGKTAAAAICEYLDGRRD